MGVVDIGPLGQQSIREPRVDSLVVVKQFQVEKVKTKGDCDQEYEEKNPLKRESFTKPCRELGGIHAAPHLSALQPQSQYRYLLEPESASADAVHVHQHRCR